MTLKIPGHIYIMFIDRLIPFQFRVYLVAYNYATFNL